MPLAIEHYLQIRSVLDFSRETFGKMATEKTKQVKEERSHSELNEHVWAVVSFEETEAMNLSYSEAAELLAELEARAVPGLCIVTNEAAKRMEAASSDVSCA